jgi:hypothetical protein
MSGEGWSKAPPGRPERESVLRMRRASYSVKRSHILNPVKALPEAIVLRVIYVRIGADSKRPISRVVPSSVSDMPLGNFKRIDTTRRSRRHRRLLSCFSVSMNHLGNVKF